MVMQAHIQHGLGYVLPLLQQLVTLHRVLTHDVVFLIRQAARLVQHRFGHHRLTQVVQQASHAGVTHGRLILIRSPCQADHQRSHRHRMQIGVLILVLDPRHAEQRMGVTRQRAVHILDQIEQALAVQRLAQAHLLKHAAHGFLPGTENSLGPLQFVFKADGSGRRAGNLRRLTLSGGRRRRGFNGLFGEFGSRLGGLARGPIGAFAGIYHYFGDRAFQDGIECFVIFDQYLAGPERVVQPRPAKLINKHALAQGGSRNFLEHARLRPVMIVGAVLPYPRAGALGVPCDCFPCCDDNMPPGRKLCQACLPARATGADQQQA